MTTHRVLVPLDGSDFSRQALPHLCRLFSPADYEVVLLRAADEPVGVATPMPRDVVLAGVLTRGYLSEQAATRAQHPIYASQIWETTVAALQDALQDDARVLKDAGFTVSTEVRFGDPAEEIAGSIEELDIDFVVMATHGRSGFQRFVLGSVAEQTLRSIQVPVMLVRPA